MVCILEGAENLGADWTDGVYDDTVMSKCGLQSVSELLLEQVKVGY